MQSHVTYLKRFYQAVKRIEKVKIKEIYVITTQLRYLSHVSISGCFLLVAYLKWQSVILVYTDIEFQTPPYFIFFLVSDSARMYIKIRIQIT